MLKSLRMRNIRSYSDEKIDFPPGSTLLSGDIGSGKSTILMAADFALFGTRRGELQGSDLLRHGKNEGSVELDFECGGAEFTVKRALKRGKSILQDTGSLTENGTEYSLSPTELKARIMDILGYPDSGKPLFRYTVYTPQEEMKSILLNPETRLEVLRNIFEADKYVRIKSNSRILLTEIRAMKRSCDALSRDLEEKEKLLGEENSSLSSTLEELKNLQESLDKSNARYEDSKKALDSMKAGYNEYMNMKIELERKESDLRGAKTRHARIAEDLEKIQKRMEESALMLDGYEEIDVNSMRRKAEETDIKREKILSRKAVMLRERDNLNSILEKNFCSVCGQKVGNQKDFANKIKSMETELSDLEHEASSLYSESKKLRDAILRHHKLEAVVKAHREDAAWLEKLEKERIAAESLVSSLKAGIERIRPRIAEFSDMEKRIRIAENELYILQDDRLKKEKLKAKNEQQISGIREMIRRTEGEIEEKRGAREKSLRLSVLDQWTSERFIPLMDVIEKNVLTNIQMEFDRFFRQWFDILMTDQLSVRIDDSFTPVIEQNGYETE